MMTRLLTTTALALALTGAAGLGLAQTSGTTGSPPAAGTTTTTPPAAGAAGDTQRSGTTTTTTSPTTTTQSTTTTTTGAAGAMTQLQSGDLLADDVIGMNVRNPQNDKIGTIHDLVMDKSGQVKAAILSVGGFLGIGDKRVAVPWSEVQIGGADRDRYASVNMNKEQLTQAPEFKTTDSTRTDVDRARARDRATTPPAGAPAGGTGGTGGTTGGSGSTTR